MSRNDKEKGCPDCDLLRAQLAGMFLALKRVAEENEADVMETPDLDNTYVHWRRLAAVAEETANVLVVTLPKEKKP